MKGEGNERKKDEGERHTEIKRQERTGLWSKNLGNKNERDVYKWSHYENIESELH
jgi:hypothetical protein